MPHGNLNGETRQNKLEHILQVKFKYWTFSIAKQCNIKMQCKCNTDNQLFQYWSPRKVNGGIVIENVCIVTRVGIYHRSKKPIQVFAYTIFRLQTPINDKICNIALGNLVGIKAIGMIIS